MKIIDSFIEMPKAPDAEQRITKFLIVGCKGIFLIIFLIYAATKLLGF